MYGTGNGFNSKDASSLVTLVSMSTTKLMVTMEDSVLAFESSKTGWKKVYESLKGTHPQCITFDPNKPNRAYCGTFGGGLWKTDDAGQTWDSIGKERMSSSDVMSVSVSSLERGKNSNVFNTVYVGTEPSAFYRSDDGGESWDKMGSLNNLSSSSSWSFPPRPSTSHVRWIESDKTKAGYVYAAIEAGALVQSHDGGRTWIDRVEGGPYDTHTLTTHKKMPGWLYSAAGDGYFESYDYGQTWKRLVDLTTMITSLVSQSIQVILKLLLYLHHNGPIKHILLKMLNHWFIEEHHHLMLMMLMIVTAMIWNGS